MKHFNKLGEKKIDLCYRVKHYSIKPIPDPHFISLQLQKTYAGFPYSSTEHD